MEYWMIYSGPGFLTVIWFGSSPDPSHPSPVSKLIGVGSLSQCSCVPPAELTDGWGQRGFDIGYRAVSCVFQNIDPPPPSPSGECVLPPQQRRGVYIHTRWAERGMEDARHRIGLYSNNLSTGEGMGEESNHPTPRKPCPLYNIQYTLVRPFYAG